MNGTILSIGDVDVTPYICYDSFTVNETAVYDDQTAFTNVLGETRRQLLGISVDISVTLRGVPASVSSGGEGGDVPPSAGEIFAVLDDAADGLSVVYAFPISRTGTFERPTVNTTITVEEDNNRLYDIALSMHCPLIPLAGL
jgi:hypothetical protein